MKKIIILLLSIFMLWGCTPKDETETKKEVQLPVPGHLLTGYWVCEEDDSYYGFLTDNDIKLIAIENGIMKNVPGETGKFVGEDGDNGVYEIKISYEDGKYRLINLDCTKLINEDKKIIEIDGKTYSYVTGEDGSFDFLRFDYYFQNKDSFFNFMKGYWNSYEGSFIRIQKNDRDEQCFMIGLYDAGGPAEGIIIDINEAPENGVFKILTVKIPGLGYPPFPETDEYVAYKLDIEAINYNILMYDGIAYYYAGEDWESAYKDYKERVPRPY